ncbi:MAG: AAA family ATPase [Alphaproteobacteria bacterium]
MVAKEQMVEKSPLGCVSSLATSDFSVIGSQKLEFSPGINIVIGENGTGKSHFLKLVYCATRSLYPERLGRMGTRSREGFGKTIGERLLEVFQPDALGRLCSRRIGRQRAEVTLAFDGADAPLSFSFATNSASSVNVTSLPSDLPQSPAGRPIFFPTREVVTLVPYFIDLYENNKLFGFDETYYDLCKALTGTLKRGPKALETLELAQPLRDAVSGKLTVEPASGRFYLLQTDGGKFEMPLVAEGMRKLAMLSHLIMNGSLRRHSLVLWDEPEANLNPKLIRVLAAALVNLAANGVQIMIATHSLFLMREISYLSRKAERGAPKSGKRKKPKTPVRYFALVKGDGVIDVQAGDDLEDLTTIASLESAVDQDNRLEGEYWEEER